MLAADAARSGAVTRWLGAITSREESNRECAAQRRRENADALGMRCQPYELSPHSAVREVRTGVYQRVHAQDVEPALQMFGKGTLA